LNPRPTDYEGVEALSSFQRLGRKSMISRKTHISPADSRLARPHNLWPCRATTTAQQDSHAPKPTRPPACPLGGASGNAGDIVAQRRRVRDRSLARMPHGRPGRRDSRCRPFDRPKPQLMVGTVHCLRGGRPSRAGAGSSSKSATREAVLQVPLRGIRIHLPSR
jgi:hypothetical protein